MAHEYLGESVEGKDVFVADDIISSGESMLDIAFALKKQGARRIFANATYAIFTNGLAAFDEAVEQGVLNGVFGTNLTYLTPELKSRAWFHEVDVSKYIAYYLSLIHIYRSGHYNRNLTTTSGDVTLKVPKLKGISFETAIIERYRRRESSVEEALIEMYLAGVSVRRVEDITEALWGSKVSPATISELNKKAYVHIED